jgi:hypothetical protein
VPLLQQHPSHLRLQGGGVLAAAAVVMGVQARLQLLHALLQPLVLQQLGVQQHV